MPFRLGEATRQHYDVGKSTISKAVRSGITRREDGSWAIDNADNAARALGEFARYLEANDHRFRSGAGSGAGFADQVETPPKPDPATDALVAELRAIIADLRSDRDAWRDQAQRLALPAPQPPQPARPRWWWLRRAV